MTVVLLYACRLSRGIAHREIVEWSEPSSPSTRACRRTCRPGELVLLNGRRPSSARALSAVKMPAQTFGGVNAHAAVRNKLGVELRCSAHDWSS